MAHSETCRESQRPTDRAHDRRAVADTLDPASGRRPPGILLRLPAENSNSGFDTARSRTWPSMTGTNLFFVPRDVGGDDSPRIVSITLVCPIPE